MSKKSDYDKKILKEMIEIFYPDNILSKEVCYDWMGYEIDDINFLTYHHITKASSLRSDGISDEATFENGACLGDLSHSALHVLEKIDKELYDLWNELFLIINKTCKRPDEEIIKRIKILQERSIKVLDEQVKKRK